MRALYVVLNSSNHNLDLDVNECETLNGGCNHQCNNTIGSFNCKCRQGFFLDKNGKTCIGKFSIEVEIAEKLSAQRKQGFLEKRRFLYNRKKTLPTDRIIFKSAKVFIYFDVTL